MKKALRILFAILTVGSTLYIASGNNASAGCGGRIPVYDDGDPCHY